jgi:PAS domain S-box-containing protein
MVYLDLILNLTLLVALSVVSGFIEKRRAWTTRPGALLQGILFGAAAVLGMLRPLALGPGLIFDGRSVMVSLCALYFGPAAAAVAGVMTILCRIAIGGMGTLTGILVILSSLGIGLAARRRWAPNDQPPAIERLYGFGLVVHLAMLALMFTLPDGAGWMVVRRIGLPVLLFYPLATILTGKILSDQVTARQRMAALRKSEQLFRAIFEGSRDAIFLTRPDARLAYANPAAAELTGYSAAALQEMGLYDLHDPEEMAGVDPYFERILAGDAALKEADIRRKDGRKVPAELSSTRVTLNGDVFMHTVARDISERKQADADLRKSERQKELILEAVSEAVVYMDTDLRVVWANRTAAEWSNLPAEDLIGTPCHLLWHGTDEACSGCPAVQSLREKRPAETEMKTPDGRHWSLRVFPVLEPDDTVSALVEFARDITARKAAEAEKQRLREKLYHSKNLESIGRLAGGVAHDLNNLLFPIIGHSEMLLDTPEANPEIQESIQTILSAGLRARDRVAQLLAFSRRQTLAFRPVDINDLSRNLAPRLREIVGTDIALRLHLGDDLPTVRGDAEQLEQILLNLASNARDAMPEGGELTIETGMATLHYGDLGPQEELTPGPHLRLTVGDTGPGMDPQTRDRIFEPFFTTKAFGEGPGLGLATVYGVVKQHGGHIRVFSEPGRGTLFNMYLPIPEKESARDSADAAPASSGESPGPETILLVDDEASVRGLAEMALQRAGYSVRTAANAREALDRMASDAERIHLLLTDVNMPEMDGRELYRRVAKRWPDLRVLFMSGYPDDAGSEVDGRNPGAHFLQKPFSIKDLTETVRAALAEGNIPVN